MALADGDLGGGGGGGANLPPVTSQIQVTTTEDAAVQTINALTGARDPEGKPLSVVNMGALAAGVAYDATSRTFSLDPSAYNALKAGASQIVTVSYGVSDGVNTTAQSLTWTVTGVNDAPTARSITLDAQEHSAGTSVNLNDLVSDPDGDRLTFTLNTVYPDLIKLDPATGIVTFKPDPGFSSIRAGDFVGFTASYTVSDGTTSTTAGLNFYLKGVNDAPTVKGPVTLNTDEGAAPVSVNASTNVLDPDNGDVLRAFPDTTKLPAGVTFDAFTQRFTLDAGNPAYNALKAGESTLVSFSYQVKDSGGLTVLQTLNWTVNGTNDAPTAGFVGLTLIENGAVPSANLNDYAKDPDGDKLTFTLNNPLLYPLALDADTGVLKPSTTAFDYLRNGETLTFQLSYTASDGAFSTNGAIVFAVVGRNDPPQAFEDSAAVDEKGTVTIDVLANDKDVDNGDALTVTGVTAPAGVSASIVNNKIVVTPGEAFDLLGPGQSQTVQIGYTIRDSSFATASSTIQLTVNGVANGASIGGGAGADSLQGTSLDEKIDGGAGNDTLDGGAGMDTLLGGAGNDLILGGRGFDSISGGDGADTVIGGSGNDTLAGGRGTDVFDFSAGTGGGRDMIIDFRPGEDDLRFVGLGFNSFSDVLAVSVQSGADVVITVSSTQVIQLNNLQLASLGAGDFIFS